MIKLLGIRNKPKVDWNINYEFIKWVNKWFKEFKKNAMIDLTFHTFKYQKKKLTQEEIIDRIIYITDLLIDEDFFYDDIGNQKEMVDEVFDLFHLVFWSMWW